MPTKQTTQAVVIQFGENFTLVDIEPTVRKSTEENIDAGTLRVKEDRNISICNCNVILDYMEHFTKSSQLKNNFKIPSKLRIFGEWALKNLRNILITENDAPGRSLFLVE